MLAFALLTLVLISPPLQRPLPSEAIDAAKGAIVGDLDEALGRLTVAKWLQTLVDAESIATWGVNDCGEQTGSPADRGRDFPLCAEVRVPLPGNRTLGLLFALGSQRLGITGQVRFFYGYVAGPLPDAMVWLKTLAEVPRHLSVDSQPDETSVPVFGRVIDEAGDPVPGARVRILSAGLAEREIETNATGAFRSDVLSSDRIFLVASHPDFGRQSTGGSSFQGPHWSGYTYGGPPPQGAVDLVLRRGVVLRGRMLDASGRAVMGEHILLLPSYIGSGPGPLMFTTSTDTDGRFRFERAVLSTFELVPRGLDDWRPHLAGDHLRIRQARDSWLAAAEADAPVELRLESYTLVSIEIDVSALESASVQVWKRWGADSSVGTTAAVNAAGRVRLLMEQGVEHELWVVPDWGRLVAPWTARVPPDWVGTPAKAMELRIGAP